MSRGEFFDMVKEEFFRYLTDYIKTAEENNKEEFDITIDTDIH